MKNMNGAWLAIGLTGAVAAAGAALGRKGSRGHRYEASEWLYFFTEPEGKVTVEMERKAREFTDAVRAEFYKWAPKSLENIDFDMDRVAYMTYASIAEHGIGLWDGDLFTEVGIPRSKADQLGESLDKRMTENRLVSRLGRELDEMISEAREGEEAGSRAKVTRPHYRNGQRVTVVNHYGGASRKIGRSGTVLSMKETRLGGGVGIGARDTGLYKVEMDDGPIEHYWSGELAPAKGSMSKGDAKSFVGEIGNHLYGIKIPGFDPRDLTSRGMSGQISANAAIKAWREKGGLKEDWIYTKPRKGQKPGPQLRKWIQEVKPSEFYAKWDLTVDDDTRQVWYKP